MKFGALVVGVFGGFLLLVALPTLFYFTVGTIIVWTEDLDEMAVIAASSVFMGFWVSLAAGFYVFRTLWILIPKEVKKEQIPDTHSAGEEE